MVKFAIRVLLEARIVELDFFGLLREMKQAKIETEFGQRRAQDGPFSVSRIIYPLSILATWHGF